MRKVCCAAVAAALTVSPAMAGGGFGAAMQAALPDTLGQVVGNMAANRVDLGALCDQGQPLPEPYLSDATKAAQALMAEYIKAAASTKGGLGAKLRGKDEGAHWIGPQGGVDLDALSDPYLSDPTHSAPELKQVVVAGDAQTIRAIWEFAVRKPDGTAQGIEYGVDMLRSYWRGYRIWHLHVYLAPDTAPVPAPYCRFVAQNSY